MPDQEPNETADDSPLLAAAEKTLSANFGGPVRLGAGAVLRERYRNRVLRCAVIEGPSGADLPASVILKASVGEGERAYNPENDARESTAWRFYNEWTATRFLNEHLSEPPLSARLLGGDREQGLIVLEDLGDGPCLADALQGDDAGRAEAALLRYAASMGRLHAATTGKEAAWRRTRTALGGKEAARTHASAGWLHEDFKPLAALCERIGAPFAPGADAEAEAVCETLDNPGPFLAFTPGDTCPDNHRLPDGDGTLRFFDFEFAGFQHALLDAAYFHLPFPTCWCVNRLPDSLPFRMEAAYREELVRGCPEAADDAAFTTAMSHACAYWTVVSLRWSLGHALENNGTWGISTVRQRHPLRLRNFARVTERHGHLPALTATAHALEAKLRALWPSPESEMPLYPPFRSPEGETG